MIQTPPLIEPGKGAEDTKAPILMRDLVVFITPEGSTAIAVVMAERTKNNNRQLCLLGPNMVFFWVPEAVIVQTIDPMKLPLGDRIAFSRLMYMHEGEVFNDIIDIDCFEISPAGGTRDKQCTT